MRTTLLLAGLCLTAAWAYAEDAAGPPTREDREEGFVPLFDGRSLDGWQGATEGYAVEDGMLVATRDSRGKIYTSGEYGDFILRFEFRLEPGANNGVAIRAPAVQKAPAYEGIEIQILDEASPRWANLKPYQYHGSIYGVVPARQGQLKPAGQWNAQEITCRGRRVTVRLNGAVIVDADLDEVEPMDGRDHPGLKRKSGHIGFLGHGDCAEFRNVRIKELKEPQAAGIESRLTPR